MEASDYLSTGHYQTDPQAQRIAMSSRARCAVVIMPPILPPGGILPGGRCRYPPTAPPAHSKQFYGAGALFGWLSS